MIEHAGWPSCQHILYKWHVNYHSFIHSYLDTTNRGHFEFILKSWQCHNNFYKWKVMPQIWLLVLGFVIISLYGYFSIFLSSALHYRIRLPAQGLAIRVGSARREIRKLKYVLRGRKRERERDMYPSLSPPLSLFLPFIWGKWGYQKLCDSLDKREKVDKRDTMLFTVCEHHLLPFYGTATITYIPGDSVVGISKFARIVSALSKRLQVCSQLDFLVVVVNCKRYLWEKRGGFKLIPSIIHHCKDLMSLTTTLSGFTK